MDVQKESIKWVMDYERKQGNNPEDVSKKNEHKGYDVVSGDKKIEVKGRSKEKIGFNGFNKYNFEALQREDNFYVYCVHNLENNNPKLIIFNKFEVLKRLRFM